ncbi:MAG: hypothetical protein ABI409_07300, partial [Ramlibacter sp.]
TSTNGVGETTRYFYDVAGNLTSVTDPRNNSTSYAYNSLGLLASVHEPVGGGVTYYVYSPNGDKLAQQDAEGNLVGFPAHKKGRRRRTSTRRLCVSRLCSRAARIRCSTSSST